MNCYIGLAKRLIKSCFPPVIPVPQLEPLDAKLIIKQEVKDNNTNKACFTLGDAHEHLFEPISFKSISDEEAWAATLAWAEAKAQEREAIAFKAASQTDTEESYDSDESDDFADMASSPLFAMAGLMRVGAVTTYVYNLDDAAAAAAMWRDDAQADAYEYIAAKKALEALDKRFPSVAQKYTAATIIQAAARGMCCRVWLRGTRRLFIERRRLFLETRILLLDLHDVEVNIYLAATIIQATARGRAVRVWKAQFIDKLAIELVQIYRMRYLKRDSADWSWWFDALILENAASPKCAMAWIKLAEQRRYVHHF
jgi:hypothetical protein